MTENSLNSVRISKKEKLEYVIEVEQTDGTITKHTVDPFGIIIKAQESNLDFNKFGTKDVSKLKEIFGLPSFNDTEIFQVAFGFNQWMEKIEKKVEWLHNLLTPTQDTNQAPKN